MIQHKISTVQVFMTSDYKNFRMIVGNRGINMLKVNNIIREIESGNDMLQYYPIQVRMNDDKLEILDGQHRFFISKKLGRPVYYIMVMEKKDMTDIARINSNVEKWKPQDFINCYIQKNNENYIKLQDFIKTYKINIGTSVLLLSNGVPGGEGGRNEIRENFETGKFVVRKWDEAVGLAEACKLFSSFEFWTDRAFVIAMHRIREAARVPMDDLVAAFLKYSGMLVKQHSHKTYIYNLEQIANMNKQKRVVLV